MKRIIIITHALMARGMKETAEFLAGDNNIASVCCFTEEQNLDAYLDNLLCQIPKEDTLIIMTDIFGGSVNQKVGKRIKGNHFYLITGINLPLLLELAVADEKVISPEFIRSTIEEARKELTFVNDRLSDEAEKKDEDTFFN